MAAYHNPMQEAARAYLFAHGRKLDQARYQFFFENGSAEAVLSALEAYQNDDGGFGHALEPDLRTPASSVIATTHAFEIFHEVHAPGDSLIVQAGVSFLVRAFDAAGQVWPMAPPAVEDGPHAPWWTYDKTPETFEGFRINPTAAVVAHLLRYKGLVSDPAWLDECARVVVARIVEKGGQLEMNEFFTVLTLRASPSLPDELRGQVAGALAASIPNLVPKDPAAWATYTVQPLEAAPAPDAFGAQHLDPTLIQRNLDYWQETQLEDGSWPIPWNWAFVDEEAWTQAERDWKGVFVVQRMRTLRAYGRIGAG
jgi:hypothetical protein